MPKAPTDPADLDDLTVLRADEANTRSCSQDEVPKTPTMPVLADGFILLQNVIIKQVAYIFDDISGEKFKRHILKFTKAG